MPQENNNTPPKIVIVSQMFYPDAAATAKVMADIALHLTSEGFSVEVICQDRSYLDASIQYPERENWNGIEINRVQLPCLDKNSLFQRIWLLVRFSLGAYRKLRISNGSLFFAVSNPPWMGSLAGMAAKKKGKPFIFLIHDLYPDVLHKLGRLSPKTLIYRIARRVTRKTIDMAEKIIVLGRDAKLYLQEQYQTENGKIAIITNWGPDPCPDETSSHFAKDGTSYENVFKVLYTGNIGEANDFEVFISAAKICLLEMPDVEFLIMGNGKRKAWLESKINTHRLPNVKISDYIFGQEYRKKLASASALFLSLEKNMKGISVPSKTYTYLSTGKPIIALVPEGSEIDLAIQEDDFGVTIPYTPEGFVEAIRALKHNKELYAEKSANAKSSFLNKYTRPLVVSKFSYIIRSILQEKKEKGDTHYV